MAFAGGGRELAGGRLCVLGLNPMVFWGKRAVPEQAMPAPITPNRYRVVETLHAVKLEEHPGSSLRDPTETLVKIPVNALIELEGRPSQSGLITVLWNGEAYSVFFDDLQEKAEIQAAAGS